ncbi:hypothetical protein QR680_003103 [Steinernema hermaphroditum]|uniref:Nuclear receptor domain-containing protein n=1 Tax=Steinernema hermaphroditum TaxID=289476 RepID=A0AA39H5K5_9BILA|nr:hypothetical protein QR680_003103 [Steinernema hermaphroditum]
MLSTHMLQPSNEGMACDIYSNHMEYAPIGIPSAATSPQPHQSRPIRKCAVCGDQPAKVHYGVLACFGCKAVRPDRDAAGKQKPSQQKEGSAEASPPARLISESEMSNSEVPSGSAWMQALKPDMRDMMSNLLSLQEYVQSSGSVSEDSLSGFSLKSLINIRLLAKDSEAGSKAQSRLSCDGCDFVTIPKIIKVIDWINGICRMADMKNQRETVQVEDKQLAATLVTVLRHQIRNDRASPYSTIINDLLNPESNDYLSIPTNALADHFRQQIPLVTINDSETTQSAFVPVSTVPTTYAVPMVPATVTSAFSPPCRPPHMDSQSSRVARPNTFGGLAPRKLPLELTKSIEEMLQPGGTDTSGTWNKPIGNDWAELRVSTPAFNRDILAKFFPESVNQNPNNAQVGQL